jgi:hypothetical protein
MMISPDIAEFVADLEIFAKRKLNYPVEVGELLQTVNQSGLIDDFKELIFHSKILIKTQEIMKRIGPGMDGFTKLSNEFQLSIKKSIDILSRLLEKAPSDVARKLTDMFIGMDTDRFNQLLKLSSDLNLIKNWQVDGKPLPYTMEPEVNISLQNTVKINMSEEKISSLLVQIQKSAILCTILFLLFLLIDSPVTILGWILSMGIITFLLYIIFQIYLMKKTPKS